MMTMDQSDKLQKKLGTTIPPISPPKTHSTSTSRTLGVFDEKQWLFPFPMLEQLPEQTQEYVCHQITKRAIAKGLKKNDTNVFNDIRFQNIIRPFRELNRFLHGTRRRKEAIQFVHSMLYTPFTINEITISYDYENKREKQIHQAFVRRIADLLIRCGLIAVEALQPGKFGICYNLKTYTQNLYYNPNLISKEDLEHDEFVKQIIQTKRRDAELGTIRDRTPPKTMEQKAEEQLEFKAVKQQLVLEDLKERLEPKTLINERNRIIDQIDHYDRLYRHYTFLLKGDSNKMEGLVYKEKADNYRGRLEEINKELEGENIG